MRTIDAIDDNIVFVGQNYAHLDKGQRAYLAGALNTAFPGKLRLYGVGWDGYLGNCGPVSFVDSSFLYGRSMATIGPTLARDRQLRRCISGRLARTLASGALYFMQSFNDWQGFGIEHNVHAIVWEELTDMIDSLRAWSVPERKDEKQAMRCEANKLAYANMTWDVAMCELAPMVRALRAVG